MMLSQLLPGQTITTDVLVNGISDDSRRVREGDVFFAMKGIAGDGKAFAESAVQQGAVAVISDARLPSLKVPVVLVENLGIELGSIASRFFGEPSQHMNVTAVTGTNGKTSFTHLLAQAMSVSGAKTGLVGTMGHGVPGKLEEPGLTTPPALDLQRRLAALKEDGCSSVVLEASSHGLVQGRLNGTHIETAVFTNITRDHLDYHETFEAYGKAKQILFGTPSLKHAVVNFDDAYAGKVIEGLAAGVEVVRFSVANNQAEVFCEKVKYTDDGILAEVRLAGESIRAEVPLFGKFNLENLLAVIATLVANGSTPQEIEQSIRAITPVAGRMDVMRREGKPTIIVDYAHTPDALEKSLEAVRAHFPERIVSCVFGCGGDRDTGKRPIMGEIASRLADRVYVTSDNPRSEDPGSIIADVMQGVEGKNAVAEIDRRQAIVRAIDEAAEADVVLVAGKGHEDYQELASGRVAFSDYSVIAESFGSSATPKNIILGLGETGLSYARYLAGRGQTFAVQDQAPRPEFIEKLKQISPDASVSDISEQALETADDIYVSPGVPLTSKAVQQARSSGVKLHGDIQMFGERANAPIVAVTGTNGKSSVVELLYQMAADQKAGVYLAGNVGIPALDMLHDDASLYVLETSSYQLELASGLNSEVAVVLNLSPDHLDRYESLDDYYKTKLAIYSKAGKVVVNRQLGVDLPDLDGKQVLTFGSDEPTDDNAFGLAEIDGELVLMQGATSLMPVSELKVAGKHNFLNVLAALAAGSLAGLSMKAMLESARRFGGLPHRMEVIAEHHGVRFVNDSKATNVGALLAAVQGEAQGKNIVLIAGGETKGARFDGLSEQLAPFVKSVWLIGEEQAELKTSLGDLSPVSCDSLKEAVARAADSAVEGDVVLLAPGCASFDQFRNYQDRGDQFRSSVMEVLA